MSRIRAGISAVEGVIDRRILANYRLHPEFAAAQLPAPFRPKLVHGFAIGGICLIRLKKVRPAALPIRAGIRSENAAHRIAVVWDDHGTQREGVYIARRDTSSRLNSLAGGRLFPGTHHRGVFRVNESADRFDIDYSSNDGQCSMRISAHVTDLFPANSLFDSLGHASHFFETGSLGYSPKRKPGQFVGLELACRQWCVQALAVQSVASDYFDDPARFPPGTAQFDNAILMRGIEHAWHQRGVLCCEPANRTSHAKV